MKLHELQPSPGSHKARKRVGRGPGSGHGKTSTRGQKGQRARTSVNVPKAFEGGQTKLTMRMPKWRGFNNKWKKTFAVLNLTRLNRFEAGSDVTPEQLVDSGIIKDVGAGIKVLGSGDLTRKLTIHAHRFSAEAKKKIEAAGGTVAVIAVPPPIREKTGGSTVKNPAGDRAWRLGDAAGWGGKPVGGARFSEQHANFLINGGEAATGAGVLKPETIAFATAVRTKDYHRDPLLDIPVNRALAVVVAGEDGNKHLRGFGRVASGRAFGHGGAGGQIGWGDPATGISAGYCTNGFVDQESLRQRTIEIGSLAAGCARD